MNNFYLLLILQYTAHLLSDFVFQTKDMAEAKNRKGFASGSLYKHVLITVVFSFLLAFQWQFWYTALLIGLAHLLIDGLKSVLISKNILKPYLFYIDQFLHLLVIYALVWLFARNHEIEFYIPVKGSYLLLIFVFLLNAKPANIFIKEVLHTFDIKLPSGELENATAEPPNESEIPNAGKLIGIIERWLVLVFVLIGQFEAVGFLLASKSILRYGESNKTGKTEYVLIGTMLSFGIAIVSGILTKMIIN